MCKSKQKREEYWKSKGIKYGEVKITPSRFSALTISDERDVEEKEEERGKEGIEESGNGKEMEESLKEIKKSELEAREIEDDDGSEEAGLKKDENEQEELIRQYLSRSSKNNRKFLSDKPV